ncbi:MAG: chloride channel protein, partial [Clostridia bacterium]|nr:chloride channel protein [Clostridia bacterium]
METEKIPQHIKYDAAQVLSSVRALLKWLLIGCGTGVIVGCAASAFAHVLIWVNDFRAAHPMIILGLPLAGLLIVFLYRICKNSDDRGTNMVIASVHSSEHLRLRTAPLIFISTAITHLFGGSAGREGAALQLGGSIAN